MHRNHPDEAARRAYWSEQIEAAQDFMRRMSEYPVEECAESLGSLPEAVATEGLCVVFSQTRIANRYERLYYLRAGLIGDFLALAREMNGRGWTLKVFFFKQKTAYELPK